ncbi:MAG: (Fe-S)-binding protein [Firmicutes bacterium]|nr:(Fe-S)-binding protein [Bacillota bacterium]
MERTPHTAPPAARRGGDRDIWSACVHCGLCLPSCPTYRVTGREELSPRGRVFLARLVDEGLLPEDDADRVMAMESCLDCRACEVVCPSGVRVGHLVERARERLAGRLPGPWRRRWAHRLVRGFVAHPGRWPRLARLGRLWQRGRLGRLPDRLLRRLPAPWPELAEALPPLSGLTVRASAPAVTPARPPVRARVALFAGCVQDVAFGAVNEAARRVLAYVGCEVVVTRAQGCCGALSRDMGDGETARALARRNLAAFAAVQADYVVTAVGGCGAMLREYPVLFAHEPARVAEAQAFARRVVDVSQLLVRLGPLPAAKPLPLRVAYHDSCHLAHVMGVRAEPRALLAAIPGVELVELGEGPACCGSAGTYNLEHPEMSARILERKIDSVPEGVDAVATGNPGCALQLAVGLGRRGRRVRVVHPIRLLAAAYGLDEIPADEGGGP